VELGKQFTDYSEDLWGITASDSEHGYVAWGGPPALGPIDGTVVPSAPGGSLPFLPRECLRVLRTVKSRYGEGAWCRYGFVNAFNPLKKWYDPDVIGIDTGITMLMAENSRTGEVWSGLDSKLTLHSFARTSKNCALLRCLTPDFHADSKR
jgi:hypothetical protein